MDHTIAGAASGETAKFLAAPKGSQSQAKGQKSTEYLFVMRIIVSVTNIICYSYDHEIGGHPISFFIRFTLLLIVSHLRFYYFLRRHYTWHNKN